MEKGTEAWDELTSKLDEYRRSVASYKSANTVLRRKVENLTKEVERYKELDLEGDHLYEEKIEECEQLKKELDSARSVKENTVSLAKFTELEQSIDTKNAFIDSLQERVQTLMLEKSELEGKVASLTEEQIELYDTIDDLRTPWYKKLFK